MLHTNIIIATYQQKPGQSLDRLGRRGGTWQKIVLSESLKTFPSRITVSPGCETWTLLADSEETVQAFETKCLRKLLRIFYNEHKTNDWLRSKINFLLSPQEPLLATVKRR